MKTPKKHLDLSLSFRARAAALVAQMTLEEKVSQMMHRSPAISRLKIPAYTWWNECLHGVGRAGLATVFPQSIGMAASFDTGLEKRVAAAISDEARAKFNEFQRKGYTSMYSGLTFWSPNINIFRDPRWGRGQETLGEDPYLSGRMGVAFVKGLQGNDRRYLKTAACAKHFAAHSGPEAGRNAFNSLVSQRDLRETYLPAFKALVQDGNVESVMTAYNRLNWHPCSAHRELLQGILRDEWKFAGHVVSDCGAIENIHNHHKTSCSDYAAAADAVEAGCDLCCGGAYAALLTAVEKGCITEETITRAAERLFVTRMKLGLFDPPKNVPWSKLDASVVASDAHRKLALEAAEKCVVLLKNDGVLPLDAKRVKSLGVCGPVSQDAAVMLGNYNGYAREITTMLSGIAAAGGAGVHVVHMKGCDVTGGGEVPSGGLYWCFEFCDVIIACVGYTPDLEGEEGDAFNADAGGDRRKIGLPGRQQELLEAVCSQGKPVIAIVTGGSAIDLAWAHEHCAAVLMTWYAGEAGGEAVGRILFGKANPAGRLPVTFPKSLDDVPEFTDYAMAGRTYRFSAAAPLYPFGYGLSYTQFRYSGLKLSKKTIAAGDPVTVSVDVKNTGKLAGDEVAQLYLCHADATLPVPRLHLEGFTRVSKLRPGESRRIEFKLAPEQFTAYRDDGTPVIEPGRYTLSVGGGQPGFATTVSAELLIK